jgi:hypothetical protein
MKKTLVGLLAILAFEFLCHPMHSAIAQNAYTLPSIVPIPLFTNTTVTATGGANITTNSTLLHRPIDIPPKTIVILQTAMTSADVGTSNVVFGFNHSMDSLNWKNDLASTATVACVGSNVTVVAHTILGTNLLTRFLSFEQLTSRQTNVVTISAANLIFIPYNGL